MNKDIILLVEDNPDDEALTLRAIRRNRIANPVIVVHDGAEALDYMFATGAHADRDVHELPAVVLLDLKLPKIDGLEVLKRVRENEKTSLTPIVILTTSNEERDIIQGYRLGANSYVRKPVDFEHFAEAVGKLGMYWLLLNQNPNRD